MTKIDLEKELSKEMLEKIKAYARKEGVSVQDAVSHIYTELSVRGFTKGIKQEVEKILSK